MFDAARHDQKLARVELNRMLLAVLTVFHDEAAFEYEEEFVFMRMLVPDEFTGKLDELDVLAIELRHNPGGPVFYKLGEFGGEIDFVHFEESRNLMGSMRRRR